jgi:hypothetical protein
MVKILEVDVLLLNIRNYRNKCAKFYSRYYVVYKCEDGAISNDPPATIIGLEVPPVNDIRKYIISSIINIVIKNNNI